MEIRAFRGWRYCGGEECDVSKLIAPPYDILTRKDKEEFLAGSDRNIVAVDLPHVPATEAGPEEAYRQAAERLGRWKAEGVLCRERGPALYAYEQTFSWAGREHHRRAMLCGVRATELGKDVIAHEHTFAGPKADRLKLMRHTRTQLSPVLGFFEDPQSTVAHLLWSAADGKPAAHGRLRGVTEKLWVLTAPGVIGEIAAALRHTPVFIADGHHRYGTALGYAQELRRSGAIDGEHEANFVFFCLVPRRDPGLLILPTHRIVRGLKKGFGIPALMARAKEFTWTRCSVDAADLRDADAFLRRFGRGAMAFLGAVPAEIWIARLHDASAMKKVAPEESDAWRDLDVAILHKLVIDKALEPWRTDELFIDYTPDGRVVLAACLSGRAQLGVCMQGTPLEAVETIARAGGVMPHKSTYFYPKTATGMVLRPLD